MDAGTEEFAIGRDAEGYHFMSISRPRGGWDDPSALKMRFDADFKPLSAEWHQFGDETTVARYTIKPDKVEAVARVNGKPEAQQDFELSAGAVFGGPALAADYFLLNALPLKAGETREYPSVTFGFQGWKILGPLSVTMKRLEDTTLSSKDGKAVAVRH
jgi:hypothetical protein